MIVHVEHAIEATYRYIFEAFGESANDEFDVQWAHDSLSKSPSPKPHIFSVDDSTTPGVSASISSISGFIMFLCIAFHQISLEISFALRIILFAFKNENCIFFFKNCIFFIFFFQRWKLFQMLSIFFDILIKVHLKIFISFISFCSIVSSFNIGSTFKDLPYWMLFLCYSHLISKEFFSFRNTFVRKKNHDLIFYIFILDSDGNIRSTNIIGVDLISYIILMLFFRR